MIRCLSILFVLSVVGCTTTLKVNNGDIAMEYKQYHKAIELFKKEINRTSDASDKARKSFLVGKCYERLSDFIGAKEWYYRAYQLGYDEVALYKHAQMLKRNEEYRKAISIFGDLSKRYPSEYRFKKELIETRQAYEWLNSDQSAVTIKKLRINSLHTDFAPSLSRDKNYLYFTSDRRESTGEEYYNWTGQKYFDVFRININENSEELVPLDIPLNTKNNESSPSFHPEEDLIVFTKCENIGDQYDQHCLLYFMRKDNLGWTKADVLPFQVTATNYMHPYFSEDGTTLFFASDDINGVGKYDIWAVDYLNESWGEPYNLGSRLNTVENELFPTVNGQRIYFSSDGRVGQGGLDIYSSNYSKTLGWLPPKHLDYPINSGGDDMSYLIFKTNEDESKQGVFASNRQASEGADDLFAFIQYPKPEPKEKDKEAHLLKLEITVRSEVYEDPTNPNSRIIDQEPIANATVHLVVQGEEETLQTNEEGKLIIDIETNEDYFFLAKKTGYLNKSANFSTYGIPKPQKETTYLLDILLAQKFIGQEIVLDNIYYDYDKANIREDAARVLDTLAQILIDNPDIEIELSSHTDCRGTSEYNQDLSQRRAESAVTYLLRKGIAERRMKAKGYGELYPKVDCLCEFCTEEEWQLNRRTAFKILK